MTGTDDDTGHGERTPRATPDARASDSVVAAGTTGDGTVGDGPVGRGGGSAADDETEARDGLAPVAKGARLTGDERRRVQRDLRTRYEGGASIRTLAVETGRSYGFVHTLLVEDGVTLRGRGGPNRRRRPRP